MRTVYFLILCFTFLGLSTCSTDDNPAGTDADAIALPTEFPLQVGNAWVYQRNYYDVGTDSSRLDTLYIPAMHGTDYYRYTWDLNGMYTLVQNDDGKLLDCGFVTASYGTTASDTTYRNPARIWALYGATGTVNMDSMKQLYDIDNDSLHITVTSMASMGSTYQVYVTSRFSDDLTSYSDQYSSAAGFLAWKYYDRSTGELTRETILQSRLYNYFPTVAKAALHKSNSIPADSGTEE